MGAETWTYDSPGIVKMDGDLTATYLIGMKVKLVQSAVKKYFIITNVAFAAGLTKLTLDGKGTYTLANELISSHAATVWASPSGGFPFSASGDSPTNRTSGSSTGTGAEQTIAHSIGGIPTRVSVYPTGTPSSTAISIRTVDNTNIYVTVTTGQTFAWVAEA